MLLESSEGLTAGLLGEVHENALLLALPVPLPVPPFRLPLVELPAFSMIAGEASSSAPSGGTPSSSHSSPNMDSGSNSVADPVVTSLSSLGLAFILPFSSSKNERRPRRLATPCS